MKEGSVLKTLIVSAFPGCGKSYMVKNNKDCKKIYIDKDNGFLDCKHDFKKYANEVMDLIGKADFIFINQYPEVLKILYTNKLPFIVVAPNNSSLSSLHTRELTKKQWFGRFYLRKNNAIWMNLLFKNYDTWTSLRHLKSMNPCKIILLEANEYLNDIIYELEELKDLYGINIIDNR